jgi:hypothetical protein
MRSRQRIGLGAFMAATAGALMAASPILGWPTARGDWGFLLSLAIGVAAGVGTALTLSGLIECKGRPERPSDTQ